jgi:hypothetical protein
MALIPGSFKTTQQEGKRLISSAGATLITPQNPAEEDPICCCEVPIVGDCELCESTAAVCQIQNTSPGAEFINIGYEMFGDSVIQGVTDLRLIGNMNLIYDGANCQWRDPDITEFPTNNNPWVNSGTFNYTGICDLGGENYFYDGATNEFDRSGCGGVDGQAGHFGNWSTILACVEVTAAAHKDILNAIGGPGLAWELRMHCTDFVIDCAPFPQIPSSNQAIINWTAFAYAPFNENSPETCYGILGPYTPVPSVAPDMAMDFDTLDVSNETEP